MPPTTGVKLKLGGKQVTLRYTMPALMKLEDARGGEAMSDTFIKAGRLTASAIVGLIWAGRLHETPDITMAEIAEQVAPPYQDLVEKVTEALRPWFGDDDKGKVPAAS